MSLLICKDQESDKIERKDSIKNWSLINSSDNRVRLFFSLSILEKKTHLDS